MRHSLFLSAILAATTFMAPAAELWAPGVSRADGWVDYNKAAPTDTLGTDSGMCWAASSANIIKWWMNNSADSLTSITVPQDPWYVFRAVYGDVGGTPNYGLGWYINGVTNQWGDLTTPEGYYKDGFATIEDKSNAAWPYGAFLSSVYDTSLNGIRVAANPGDTDGRALTLGILNAMEAGYALSLSAYGEAGNWTVAHAITLWGVEYTGEGDERVITKMWVTDSDDGKEQLVEYAMASKGSSLAFAGGTMSGATIRYADGMRVIPEPATATLSLLALAGLAARRRRK